jgi:glycerate 2-kinase
LDYFLMLTKQHLLAALQQALLAVDPGQAIHKYVQRQGDVLSIDSLVSGSWDLNTIDVRLVVVGKAALPMAQAMADLAGDQIDRAVIIMPLGSPPGDLPASWQIVLAAHPLPDAGSVMAGMQVRQLLAGCTANTLLLVGVSGGATALLVAPQPEISLTALRLKYQELLASGADITTMNRVRASLDQLKGGGLVAQAQPAQVVGLILSDVVGDAIATIGSGLTNHPQAQNILVGNNQQACQAAAAYLQAQGYRSQIITTKLQGEAQVVGGEIARSIVAESPGTALIYGGETTVTLPPGCDGQGGRNQELVLGSAIALHDLQQTAWIASLGTDGIDGQSDAAGAIVNEQTLLRGERQQLLAFDYLQRHDSYNFLRPLDALIWTGATGTNVADIVIAIRT